MNIDFIKHIPHNSTIIIGFSGGPDSLYLLLLLKKVQQSHNLNLIAAHLDHEWRTESAQEAQWCKQFCKEHNIPFIFQKASQLSLKSSGNGSKEQHARQLRRLFFETIAQQHHNAYIALAHHQDDQLETFFIRLARGTSLTGLCGMKELDQSNYLRPLLNLTKQEILTYLDTNKISYLQDPTNSDQTFLRNRIRHTLVPLLPSIDPRLVQHTITTMKHLTSVDELLEHITQQTITQISTHQQPLSLNTELFLQLHTVLQQRILLHLLIQAQATFIPSQSLFAEIIRFLQTNKHTEHTIHQTYKIVKNKNSFSIIKQ